MSTQNPKQSRSTLLMSASVDANKDIRIICNGIKKTTALAAACVLTNIDAETICKQTDDISNKIIGKLGLSSSDTKSQESLLAIISEPVSLTLRDAALMGATSQEICAMGDKLVETMTSLARSKTVSQQISTRYASDIHSAIALRMTASAALAGVASEISEFDFFIGATNCMKEASKDITQMAFESADFLNLENSSVATRVMLTQSMITSAGKLYSACYRSVADKVRSEIESLPLDQALIKKAEMNKIKPKEALNDVTEKFTMLFELCVNGEFNLPQYLKTPDFTDSKKNKPT